MFAAASPSQLPALGPLWCYDPQRSMKLRHWSQTQQEWGPAHPKVEACIHPSWVPLPGTKGPESSQLHLERCQGTRQRRHPHLSPCYFCPKKTESWHIWRTLDLRLITETEVDIWWRKEYISALISPDKSQCILNQYVNFSVYGLVFRHRIGDLYNGTYTTVSMGFSKWCDTQHSLQGAQFYKSGLNGVGHFDFLNYVFLRCVTWCFDKHLNSEMITTVKQITWYFYYKLPLTTFTYHFASSVLKKRHLLSDYYMHRNLTLIYNLAEKSHKRLTAKQKDIDYNNHIQKSVQLLDLLFICGIFLTNLENTNYAKDGEITSTYTDLY